MALTNKTIIEQENIRNKSQSRLIKVSLVEETLSDNSKAYNIETAFMAPDFVGTLMTFEDASCYSFKEAWKRYNRIINGLSVLEDSEVL